MLRFEIIAALRAGISKNEDAGAVILEADGTFSMIKDLSDSASALADIPARGGCSLNNEEPD